MAATIEPAPTADRSGPPSGLEQVQLGSAMADLSVFFKRCPDRLAGTSAYSANPSTVALIAGTSGVTPLTAPQGGDEIWVKY